MKAFRVVAKIPFLVTFRDDTPTEKSAEHVVRNIALHFILKEGISNIGWFSVEGDDAGIEIESIESRKVTPKKNNVTP